MHVVRGGSGEDVAAELLVEGVVLVLVGLHDRPAALVGVEVEERLDDGARLLRLTRHDRARVELRAVALEDVLEPRVLVPRRLRHRGPERRGIVLHPRLDAHAGQVAAKRGHPALVPGAGEDALVRRETPRADPEVDERARLAAREPDDARAAVGSGGRVVRVDDARVGHALVAVGERIGVTDRRRRVVPLLVAVSEERVDVGPEAAVRAGEAMGDDPRELRQAVGRHRPRVHDPRETVLSQPAMPDKQQRQRSCPSFNLASAAANDDGVVRTWRTTHARVSTRGASPTRCMTGSMTILVALRCPLRPPLVPSQNGLDVILIASPDLTEIGPPEMRLARVLPNQAATVAPV